MPQAARVIYSWRQGDALNGEEVRLIRARKDPLQFFSQGKGGS
jgi:hypothetical protein